LKDDPFFAPPATRNENRTVNTGRIVSTQPALKGQAVFVRASAGMNSLHPSSGYRLAGVDGTRMPPGEGSA
jgi:hypothetical protein